MTRAATRRPARRGHVARRQREQDIVAATKRLWDERGLQDAGIGDIARAVGINKALIYRHFSSKEELYVLTVTRYLGELAERLEAAPSGDPDTELRSLSETYADYCLERPAFLDCALSLMRRPAAELRERLSQGVWVQLGQAMSRCLATSSRVLAAGAEAGVFDVADPDFTANQLYTQMLGTMHLARIRVGVREDAPGVPGAFPIDPARVREAAVAAALATVQTS